MICLPDKQKRTAIGIVVLLNLAVVVQTFGQTLKVVPPTPNAAKMTEYYATQPNMYTGTANVSVPLYTIDFDGWQLPLSLSYNATGVRTTEEASEVGLGWALNANGIVSRTVRGGDDLYRGTAGGNQRVGWVHNSDPFTLQIGYDQYTQRFADPSSYYYYIKTAVPDTEPDIFNYNFFGFSGSFVLTQKIVNGVIEVKKLTEDASAITFAETGETFTIITPTGYKGEFTVKERSTSMAGLRTTMYETLACGEDYFDHLDIVNWSGRYRNITSWHLSKITSPRGRIINFNYLDIDINGNSPYISNQRTFAEDDDMAQALQCLQTIHEHVYLKEIVSTDIGLRVDFTMAERSDLRKNEMFTPGGPGGILWQAGQNLKRYTGLTITGLHPESGLSKAITFNQNYFNQHYFNDNQMQEENEVRWLRSRLDGVKIDDQEYSFLYHEGAKGVPNKMTHGVDYFGFYNGHDEITHLLRPFIDDFGSMPECKMNVTPSRTFSQAYNRTADIVYGVAGTLKQMRYPTRGYSEYEYEAHTYNPDQTTWIHEAPGVKPAGGTRVKSIKDFDYDGTLQKHKRYKYEWATSPGGTSGVLMTPLLNLGRTPRYIFNDPAYGQPNVFYQCDYIIESMSSIPGNNAAEGKVIGYSQVHEYVEGGATNYKNSYYFENTENIPLQLPIASEGFPNLNGKVKEARNYGDDGKIAQVTQNFDYNHNIETIHGLAYRVGIPGADHIYAYQYYDIRRTFHTPFQTVTKVASLPSQVQMSGDVITNWGSHVSTQKDLVYSNYQLSKETTTSSNGDVVETQLKRVRDYPASSGPLFNMKLPSVNMVDPVIETIVKRNGAVISATGNLYSILNGPTLTKTYQYNKSLGSFVGSSDGISFPSPYEARLTINSFEPITMKPREYLGPDGVLRSYIWGYNGDLPIVEGVGVTYNNLNTAHTAAGPSSPTYETGIRSHSAVAGGLITTYKHRPFVGVASITNAAGLKNTYEYDQYDRLTKIKDNDGNILEQYDYKYRQPDPQRLLTIEGNLDFGTLVPDFFVETQLEYDKCSEFPDLTSKVIKLKNTGESPISIYSISILPQPQRFKLSGGQSGTIAPGTSMDLVVTFDDAVQTIPFGTYTSTFTVTSNATNTVSPVAVSANYVARVCNLSVTPSPTKDFGVTMGNILNQPIVVKNNGNAVHRVIGTPLNWNGSGGDYTLFTDPDFSMTPLGASCMKPGETYTLYAHYQPTGNGQHSATLSVITDWCPALTNVVTLLGEKIPSNGTTSKVTPNPVNFAPFTTSTSSTTVTLTNRSMYPAGFDGVSINNAKFTISPTGSFMMNGFEDKVFTLTYNAGMDFTQQTGTLIFDGEFGPESIGANVTAQRTSVKTITVSPSSMIFNPPLFTPQYVTVTNTGNNNVTVSSVTNPNTFDWDVTTTNLPSTLAPGGNVQIAVRQKTSGAQNATITINSDGIGANTVALAANKKIIQVAPITFSSFTAATGTASTTVFNTGNVTLTVTGGSCTDGLFTSSPASFTVAPGGSQPVTISFTPPAYDFTLHSGTFTFASDATEGSSSRPVSAQRSPLRTIQVSPSTEVFGPPLFTYHNITVTNVGTDYLVITGVSNPNTFDWDATITPTTLAINQSTTLKILQKTTTAQTAVITVTSNANGGSGAVTVMGAPTKIISVTPSSYTFPSFSGATTSATFQVGNSGNQSLTVSSVSNTNGKFSVTPTSFVVSPGASQTVTVTYTPTDFSTNSATITFNSDMTSGNGTLNVTATRSQLYQATLSQNSLSVKPSQQTPQLFLTNTGNVNVTVNSISNSNTTNFNVTWYKYQSSTWVPVTLPYTFAPGSMIMIQAATAQSGNYSGATGTATVFMSQGTNPTISLVRSTF